MGEQEGSAYNGHFGCTCYHPLFVFNQLGDVERCALRPGKVHSADGWRAVLEPVIARYRGTVKRLYFRGDAAFANPEIYEFLEGEGIGYAIRLPANRVLQDRIGYLLNRSVGRPSHEVRRYFASFGYQAQSWKKSRRVVAKVEWHPGELYPRVGFIVTDLARPAERVIAFYDQRGTAEQWIKEGTRNLTLHYDRMMLLLDPTSLARGLARQKVEVVNYPDGRFAVQFNGATLGFKVFDKIQTVQPGAIVDNKRLSAVLEQVKAQQAAHPARQQRGHVARQRRPNNLEAPGLPSTGRARRRGAAAAAT
jgi:hypothetical protein